MGALMLEFAPYLKSYPNVAIVYNGEKINPSEAEYASTDLSTSRRSTLGEGSTRPRLSLK